MTGRKRMKRESWGSFRCDADCINKVVLSLSAKRSAVLIKLTFYDVTKSTMLY